MNIHSHKRAVSPGCSFTLLALVLATLGFAACGGSGGDSGKNRGGAPSQGSSPPPPPTGCTEQQYAAIWASLACPDSMLCTGEVHGSVVTNFSVLTSGKRPDWSPDGRAIAFERNEPASNGGSGIFRINTDGSGETRLGDGREPAWSPDGNSIAFRSNDGIAVMKADGSETVMLAVRGSDARAPVLSAPAWAPDGQRIVFAQNGTFPTNPAQLTVVNRDGSDSQHLSMTYADRWQISDPSWSPDGGTIAFSLNENLAVIDAAGGDPTFIPSGKRQPVSRPAWSRDGSSISYSAPNSCLALDVFSVGSNGGTSTLLIAGAKESAWSADGSRLAFASAVEAFPPVTQPASVYLREDLEDDGSRSRYVLDDSGRFELQYSSLRWGSHSYGGDYRWENDVAVFSFDDNSGLPWRATGRLDGTRLSVTYNFSADMAGFAAGVYILSESYQ